jgi:hypothetical protein
MGRLLRILCSVLLIPQASSISGTAVPQNASTAAPQPVLEDGTPVKLRISQTVSSADAHVDDRVEFEVLEEVRVADVIVIPKGGDSVRLFDGRKAALRAVKDAKGGSHTGAMTAGIVATGLLFWPAAPFFLFMHGKDITIPKGAEVPTFVNGNFRLESASFRQSVSASSQPLQGSSPAIVAITSTPAGAEISVDQNFIGNTPSSTNVAAGKHLIFIKKPGFKDWEREIVVSGGNVNLSAELIPGTTPPTEPARKSVSVTANSSGGVGPIERDRRGAIQPAATPQPHSGWIGVSTKKAKTGGASITALVPTSPADEAGLRVGDIIMDLNGAAITDQDFDAEIATYKPGTNIVVSFMRGAWGSVKLVTVGESPL